MQGQWIRQAPYYRCRFPSEYALANKVDLPRNVYLREDAFGADLLNWLATGTWISQAKAQRVQAETALRNAATSTRLTRRQIADLIEGITDVAAMLADADPAKAADAYDKLGLRLTYNPQAHWL